MTKEEMMLFLTLTIVCVALCVLIAMISYCYHYKDDIKEFLKQIKNQDAKDEESEKTKD